MIKTKRPQTCELVLLNFNFQLKGFKLLCIINNWHKNERTHAPISRMIEHNCKDRAPVYTPVCHFDLYLSTLTLNSGWGNCYCQVSAVKILSCLSNTVFLILSAVWSMSVIYSRPWQLINCFRSTSSTTKTQESSITSTNLGHANSDHKYTSFRRHLQKQNARMMHYFYDCFPCSDSCALIYIFIGTKTVCLMRGNFMELCRFWTIWTHFNENVCDQE